MKTNNFIYGIFDPTNNELRYIGKTSIGLQRFRDHLSERELKNKTYKSNWLKGLLSKGLVPRFEIIEEAPKEQLEALEIFYISYFKFLGCRLTNLTKGGEGCIGRVCKEETKKKIGQRVKASFTEEKRKIYSERMKKNYHKMNHGEEYKKRLSESHKKYKVIDLDTYKIYPSMMSVCKEFNYSSGQLSDVLNEKTITVRDKYFSWHPENVQEDIKSWCIKKKQERILYKEFVDKKKHQYKSIKHIQTNQTYPSIKDACQQLNLKYSSVIMSIKQNRDHKGHTFQYV